MNSSSELQGAMLKVGLTGGIACGKSNVLRNFRALGTHTIDADRLSREVVEPGKPAYREIVETFGEGMIGEDGTLDRKALGDLIFADSEARQRLNRLVHPHILAREDELLAACDPSVSRIIVVDAALMLEVGTYRRYDLLVVTFCPPEEQLRRLTRRNQLSIEEAQRRIASQLPVYRKLLAADYGIDTAGDFENTREQVEQVYRELLLRIAPLR